MQQRFLANLALLLCFLWSSFSFGSGSQLCISNVESQQAIHFHSSSSVDPCTGESCIDIPASGVAMMKPRLEGIQQLDAPEFLAVKPEVEATIVPQINFANQYSQFDHLILSNILDHLSTIELLI